MIMNPRKGKYPENLIRFLRGLDPKAPIIDCYEKDLESLEQGVEDVTEIKEEMMFYDFWVDKESLKYLSKRYCIDYPKVKPILLDIANKLLTVKPDEQ